MSIVLVVLGIAALVYGYAAIVLYYGFHRRFGL
jgi:hypothetical protein